MLYIDIHGINKLYALVGLQMRFKSGVIWYMTEAEIFIKIFGGPNAVTMGRIRKR